MDNRVRLTMFLLTRCIFSASEVREAGISEMILMFHPLHLFFLFFFGGEGMSVAMHSSTEVL